jgi:hypothetical protein
MPSPYRSCGPDQRRALCPVLSRKEALGGFELVSFPAKCGAGYQLFGIE